MNILLVEDDALLADAICDGVRQQEWAIEHAANADTAKAALLNHAYSVIVLDIGLPGASGLSVLRWMRERYDATPVLIITARGQLSERIKGLDDGADDYLIKPFEFDELLARLRALIRRSKGHVVGCLSCGEVRVDPEKRIVTRGGERVVLSAHEYRTLLVLIERPGRVVTRDYLQQAVYGNHMSVESNTIAVFIHQLRRKLGDHIVVTVHGHGYMIGEPQA
ncbi:response regulator transcription factor [Janthinobacterium agaricidamnosum]|uniref:Response regulator n=1 Tax=Janthinobacterium agaricidamnosum NBRC 102515 = DSM 9628 TaxID=1349767 RepID=W0VF05_9BURK|nr:response regulator transcription factor [Janthinobacterium agaricidamnosum]CDG85927.1 response regulator [Janthinobacterium agaricidamnosum NBRC 102515 = DSM 9628]